MLHVTIMALVEAGVLIGAGAFARNLGVFNSLDAQVPPFTIFIPG